MQFYGVYNKTIFRNEENGYTVFAVNSKEADEYKNENGSIICCGIIPVCTRGTPLFITGTPIIKHNNYSIDVEDLSVSSNSREITIQYLSSDVFKGMGRKTAEKVADLIGNDISEFIKQENAEQILENSLTEFKNGKAHQFISIIKNTLYQRDIFKFLQCVGGTYSEAVNLYDKYGINAIKELKDEPYKVGYKSGIPFVVCDCIARKENIYYLDKRRIDAIIYEALNISTNFGNTYTTLDELFSTAKIITKNSAYPVEVPSTIIATEIENCKAIVCTEECGEIHIYNKKIYNYENGIVSELLRIQKSAISLPFKELFIDKIEKMYNIKYSSSQKKTFNFLNTSGLKILCGYAGTGKTTVQKGLIAAYTMMFPNSKISLCAPTGRAAQRMSETTGHCALTIHKLLEVKPFKDDDYKCKGRDDQLDSDLIIVDEGSMIDTELFYILLQSIKNGCTVIICGDPSQLQSVGPGNVLLDLIKTKKFEVNTLDIVYRQSKDSKIVENANKIRVGNKDINSGKEFEIIRVSSQAQISEKIMEIYKKYFNISDPFNMQILSSTKKGDSGTFKLNKMMQSAFNGGEEKIAYGKLSYRVGDVIMMLNNNYELDYYNGEIGVVESVEDGIINICINEKKIEIPSKLFKDITLAYAATIHKSQGSEFPIVVVALSKYPISMLNRNLLYTAVTRARKKVYLISEYNALEIAINKEAINSRKTSLYKKISEKL